MCVCVVGGGYVYGCVCVGGGLLLLFLVLLLFLAWLFWFSLFWFDLVFPSVSVTMKTSQS